MPEAVYMNQNRERPSIFRRPENSSLIFIKNARDYWSFHSGSGLPLVSGAKGKVARPTRKIAHMVMAE